MKEHLEMETAKREGRILRVLIAILVIFNLLIMLNIYEIQTTQQAITNLETIQGTAQRLIKLEITGTQSPELVQTIDSMLHGLKFGKGQYSAGRPKSSTYDANLTDFTSCWWRVKDAVSKFREDPGSDTEVVLLSEQFYHITENALDSAKQYVNQCNLYMTAEEMTLAVLIVVLWIFLIQSSIKSMRIARANNMLNQKAYIDIHTGLPNKSKCEEIFSSHAPVDGPTACIMFDLNDLKKVNDTLGHTAGDTMIQNFANVLKQCILEEDFVGRYGGDEFVAIIHNTTEEAVQSILQNVQETIDRFNQFGRQVPLSFASGYAISTAFKRQDITLQILLEKADQYMYKNKQAMKAKKRAQEENRLSNTTESKPA
jgi:diguanylate cyclase (GGDEF)-like protein